MAVQKKSRSHRQNCNAGKENDMVDVPHHFRLTATADCSGLPDQPGGIGFISYSCKNCPALSTHSKTAGQELTAGLFFDFIRLTCKKRFIDIQLPLQNSRISWDLHPCSENYNISQHKAAHGNFNFFPIPQCRNGCFIHECQPVNRALGADLLNCTDQRVCKNSRQKRQAFIGSRRNNHHRQNQINQIKIGKKVLADNLRNRSRIGDRRDVSFPASV